MQKQIKKRNFMILCLLIGLAVVFMFISGCVIRKNIKPASEKSALAYLEENYGKDDYEIKLLKENYVAPYKNGVGGIDGSYFYEDAPARKETCYLVYSPKNDLYFYVFHSTDNKASKTYSATLESELYNIEKFDKARAYAKEVFGERFKGENIHLYIWGNLPIYDKAELKPIYSKPDSDARSAYNRLHLDIKDPFSSEIMYINRKNFGFVVSPCLNVYVDYPLNELNLIMKQKIDDKNTIINKFESINSDMLFIANDGIYNRPYLTLEMFNALR